MHVVLRKISSIFPSNSEADASELLGNIEDMSLLLVVVSELKTIHCNRSQNNNSPFSSSKYLPPLNQVSCKEHVIMLR